MFKNKTVMEIKKGEKVYTLQCDCPTSLTELVEVLCEFRSSCLQLLVEQVKDQDEQTHKQLSSCESVCESACEEPKES